MPSLQKHPITVLCGFLGSGKTTLLRHWRMDKELQDAALIVHDLSEFGVDVELLADETSTPQPGRVIDRVAALHGVHARKHLHTSVGNALNEIANLIPAPSHVLCESTGAARPWPLITALIQHQQFYLRHFIVTVDALNLHRDFQDGRAFIEQTRMTEDLALKQAAEILTEQLLFASVIILTKVDSVSKAVVNSQIQVLRTLQPHATIALSAHAGIRLAQLDPTPPPDVSTLQQRAEKLGLTLDRQTADDVEAVVLSDPRPFHPQRLFDVCQNYLGTSLYRTKGYIWLASRPGDVLLWQQSGSQISFELTGVWGAEAIKNRYGKLLDIEIDMLQKQLEATHPVFGDRRNTLTLIGLPHACAIFAEALKGALCTDEEVRAWQRGSDFIDPWPQSVRKS